MDTPALDRLTSYRPADVPDTDWAAVRPFVLALVAPVDAPAGSVPALAGVATQLALWGRRHGFPLDAATLLSPMAVESFVATKAAHQGTVRSWLRRLAAANGLAAAPSAVTITYGAAGKKRAYTPEEVELLTRFAHGLSNAHRSVSLRAVLSLGLGCGLMAADMRTVTASDVHLHTDGLLAVRAGDRCVPVLGRWADELAVVCEQRPTGPLIAVGTSRNMANKPNSWTRGHADVPSLSTWRLRATWVVEHLTLGASLVELMWWMKVRNVEALQPYYEQVTYTPSCAAVVGDEVTGGEVAG